MDNIFLVLFIVSFICFFVGLIKPTAFSRFFKGKATRKMNSLIFGVIIISSIALFNLTTDVKKVESKPEPVKLSSNTTEVKKVVDEPNVKTVEEVKFPKYQIVHELANVRYDGGKNYYVLMEPADLKTDSFKEDVKKIVKKIVSEKGGKISIEIHDKKESLTVSYKQYDDKTLGRVRTKAEGEELALHYIASYSGQLEVDTYLNTLYFFPGAFADTPKVGKYVETIEFDATK